MSWYGRSSILFVLIALLGCSAPVHTPVEEAALQQGLYASAQELTDVMVYDIFSPPQASRVYAYAHLAAYEASRIYDTSWRSLAPQLNGSLTIPVPAEAVDPALAAIVALQEVGIAMLYSYDQMEAVQQAWMDSLRPQVDPQRWERSVAYGKQVADTVLAYAAADGYDRIRTLPRYVVTHHPGKWKPTPPGYMDAIDPNWNQLRSFTLDAAQQFQPPPPTVYDPDTGSRFYQEMLEVYEAINTLSTEQQDIAAFWDCNPYVAFTQGHFMMGNKKITPGGHWMGIAQTACKRDNRSFIAANAILAHTAIALADGFISCWDEKYRSHYIRPETAINQLHDPDWKPLLQTPPFPEYTSGHSVISTAAATVLTAHFGESFAYIDSVEVPYGLPARSYAGFLEASGEAAISRLYGGIHFMPAIDNGVAQGRQVGLWVVDQLTFK